VSWFQFENTVEYLPLLGEIWLIESSKTVCQLEKGFRIVRIPPERLL
jgi:hypothetical protein